MVINLSLAAVASPPLWFSCNGSLRIIYPCSWGEEQPSRTLQVKASSASGSILQWLQLACGPQATPEHCLGFLLACGLSHKALG